MRQGQDKRMPSWLVGLIVLVVIGAGALLAFSSLLGLNLSLPWSDTYEVKAVFSSAQGVRETAPVRIAGVVVGEVRSVEPMVAEDTDLEAQSEGAPASESEDVAPGEQAAIVTMALTEDARPIREDAQFKLRPRLFLEGNYFVDLKPGSPNAEEVDSGHTFPVNQTAYSVQLDQIFTTLQADVRTDLQIFLNQFGNALIKYGGAEGFRELYRSSPAANKYTSQVNEAFLGTEDGDLGSLIKGLDRVVKALGRNEQTLQSLIGNFETFTGSFAAEDAALGRAIEELPGVLDAAEPAFANLNSAFPSLRAFAREALPGTRSAPATLDAAIPFIEQIRALVSRRELRGLVADLRPTIPRLATLVRTNTKFLKQTRRFSSCFNEVVIPWSHDTVEPIDPLNIYNHDPVGRVFEETAYGLVGIAGESRSGDANGQYIRVGAGGGLNTVKIPPAGGGSVGFDTQGTVGFLGNPLNGSIPQISDSAKTRFRPDIRCETQEPPNLQGRALEIPFEQNPVSASARAADIDSAVAELEGGDLRRLGRMLGAPRGSLDDFAAAAPATGGEER